MVVYYESAKKYAIDYFNSIRNQSTKEFDLLLICDNIPPPPILNLHVNTHEMNISTSMSPSMIRYQGIMFAIENGYNQLIFSDIDDYFSDDRISISIQELKTKTFLFNKIMIVDETKNFICSDNYLRKTNMDSISSYKQLLDYNILGLTHTAINLKSIKNIPIPEDVLATDWWLFSILLLQGWRGKYISSAITYYRQSEDNLVGMQKTLTAKRLHLGIRVKQNHYKQMVEYCKCYGYLIAMKEYWNRLEAINELSDAIGNRLFQDEYIKTINLNMDKIYLGWWSEILTLREWKLYENKIL